MDETAGRAGAPEPSGQRTMVLLALAASVALLTLDEGHFPWLQHGGALAAAYVVALSAPVAAALLLRRAADAYAWACALGVAAVWGGLAAYAGATGLPAASPQDPPGLSGTFVGSAAVALFVALAFLAAARSRPRFAYAALFTVTWDHALALVVAGVFTGLGWLVLSLWAGLFKIIGIELFEEVFFSARFAHPATGLFLGLGLVLGRSEAGIVRALLRLCLTAGTVLLPLIALVGVSFALALPFTGLEGLWNTRRAAALLITLVLGTVALANAVVQDATRSVPPYPRWLNGLVSAGIAVLPVFALLAAWALALRVRQYGWTLDRLYGALVIGVAGCYALGYAAALIVRRPAWLGLAAPVNVAVACVLGAGLVASISPGADFRVHAARAQYARALADPDHADVDYLRWSLGQPGVRALQQLETQPAVTAHADVLADIRVALARKQRWGTDDGAGPLRADQFAVFPAGSTVPAPLLRPLHEASRHAIAQCSPRRCALLAVDLNGDGADEWVLLAGQPLYLGPTVFGQTNGQWKAVGTVADYAESDKTAYAVLLDALRAGRVETPAPRFNDLSIGEHRYTVQPQRD